MAPGELRAIIKNGKKEYFTEYKLKPGDKSLAQVAREQLYDESLHTRILKWLDVPNAQGFQFEEIAPNAKIADLRTVLLPPSDYATFTLTAKTNVRKTARVEGANVLYAADANAKFVYKKSTVIKDGNGMLWADVSKTDPQKNGGGAYWVCVRDGTITNTNPPIG